MTELEFARLYEEQQSRVQAYIAARIQRIDDAEDLAADVFTKAFAAIDTYHADRAAFSTWLYTIASNTVRDYLRRTSVRGRFTMSAVDEMLNALPDDSESGFERLCRAEMLDALAVGLRRLPETQRQIVVLQFFNRIPQKDIAIRLGLSYTNTRYLSHKAVAALKADFRQQGLL